MFFPSVKALQTAYRRGRVAPLGFSFEFGRQPAEIFQLLAHRPGSVFLDSARLHPRTATHSYMAWNPFLRFRSRRRNVWIESLTGRDQGTFLRRIFKGGKKKGLSANPLEALREVFSMFPAVSFREMPHFTGGAIGYLGYDLAHQFERLPRKAREDSVLPEICLLFFRDVLVYGHFEKRYTLVTNLFPQEGMGFKKSYETACSRILEFRKFLARVGPVSPNGVLKISHFHSTLSREAFEAVVLRAKAYIRAGDIYQANLSQRLGFEYHGHPYRLYLRLRKINPSPFAAFLNLGNLKILSASPERLIRLQGRVCETRPIAGTRPRGRSSNETRRLSRELLLSEKERAEHLMLLDLERNDLGKVCDYETVRVNEKMILEKYSHVIHIVSNVIGRLAKGKDAFDLIRAVFPGGTITGCPKVRCMEIIDELEPVRRGIYTGSIGYLGFNGNLDFNIVIRTLILQGRRGMIHVGSGIVHDSIPQKEYEETLYKGAALLEAIGMKGVS